MSIALSIREQCLRAIKAALSGPGTPALNVFRSKLDTLVSTDFPCYDISPGSEKVEDPGEYGDRFSVTHTLPVTVRSIVNAAIQEGEDISQSSAAPVDDSALDPFYVFATQTLMGAGGNLGGLAVEITEMGGPTIFQPDGHDFIGLEQTFEIKFATKRGDPTQKG